MRALRARLVRIQPTRLDALLAIAILIELELECWIDRGIPNSHRPIAAVAVVLFAAPIAVRRRWPAAALVFSSAVATIQAPLAGDLSATNGVSIMIALIVLAYAAGAWLDVRRGLGALILALGAFSGFVFDANGSFSGGIPADVFFAVLVFCVPWFVGRVAHERSVRADAFRALAAQTAAEHEQREQSVITQERVRIGGELQDIIAHSVSAMVIQAGGARQLLRSDPERARDSILAVEQTGREALGDLRRLLGMLRKDDDPRALAPQPGLDQLATLLHSIREAGLECELREEGEPIDLTPGIDLVGYRVVEATLRSAASQRCPRAVVTISYAADWLALEIRGEGALPDLERELRGMSERVALYNGSLRTLPADGFALQARLPLGAAITA
jgi:signal transduction histidine kinase